MMKTDSSWGRSEGAVFSPGHQQSLCPLWGIGHIADQGF